VAAALAAEDEDENDDEDEGDDDVKVARQAVQSLANIDAKGITSGKGGKVEAVELIVEEATSQSITRSPSLMANNAECELGRQPRI
jgi:hypothetical protein